MGSRVSRTLQIQISNKTQNFTLENPRTFLLSGQSCFLPSPELLPGSTDSCHFSSSSKSSAMVGLLAYEAKSFTWAILFLLKLESCLQKLGLELSLGKAHQDILVESFIHFAKGMSSPGPDRTSRSIHEIHQDHQEPIQMSAGPVKVMATMSHSRSAIIRVMVREQGEAGKEIPGTEKHIQEK